MIWTKIAKLEVWWHPPMMLSATIPTTLRLSRHRPHGEVFSSRHSRSLLMDSFAQWPYTGSGSRTGAVAVLVPVVKRETAEQCTMQEGACGGWEAIFRNSGGVQGTMGWCENSQCVPGSYISLFLCESYLLGSHDWFVCRIGNTKMPNPLIHVTQ